MTCFFSFVRGYHFALRDFSRSFEIHIFALSPLLGLHIFPKWNYCIEGVRGAEKLSAFFMVIFTFQVHLEKNAKYAYFLPIRENMHFPSRLFFQPLSIIFFPQKVIWQKFCPENYTPLSLSEIISMLSVIIVY